MKNKNIFICAILVVMMLACVSAVSAEDNLNADLAAVADDAVDLSIDDVKGSETLSTGSSSGEILAADETVVTNGTFYNYFDKDGVLNKSISVNELTFEGEFSNLGVNTITIDTPVSVLGKNTTLFKDIGFMVLSDNVTLTGFKIVRTIDGAAIDIKGSSDVTVDDVAIEIGNVGKEDTFAIRAIESNNLKLLNNVIYYNAGVNANNTNVYQQAIQVRDSNNVIIRKNHVDAYLPAFDVDYSKSGIDQDYPLAVGIQNGENITFAENAVQLVALNASGSYPTLDLMMVKGVKNLEIKDNDFIEMDQNGDNKAGYLYLLDIYAIDGGIISGNNITVTSITGDEGKGSVYGMQLNGVTTDFVIDNNTFTSEGKHYAYGIYCSDSDYVGGKVYAEITNNLFDITGKPGTGKSNLVTAMELSITEVMIANNEITTKSIADYSDVARLFGICYSSSNKRNHTYTIKDNKIKTDGKYAVFLMNVVDANVTDNLLLAHEAYGDDAVYVDSGSNIVENNIPPFVVTNDTFFNYFDENGVLKVPNLKELKFEGNFSNLGIDTIILDTPVVISGDISTVIEGIGFKIISDNVKLNNVTINKQNGTAVEIQASNVAVVNSNIEVLTEGISESYVIRAVESDNLNILNNNIFMGANFNASDVYQHAIDIRGSENVTVKNNLINSRLPPVSVNWAAVGIDQDYSLAVGIQDSKNVVFAENRVVTFAFPGNAYGTLDVIMVYNVTDLEVIDNNISEFSYSIFTKDVVLYLYALDLYSSNNVLISGNNINVDTPSGVDASGTAYPIQMTGPLSNIYIDQNNLVANSNGPTLGIYGSNWAGPIDVVITNNVINVTGFAGDAKYSSLSGIELVAEDVSIFGNEITVNNLNTYNDSNKAYGISCTKAGNYTFDIMYNTVKTDGKYAVYLENSDSNVMLNTLYGNELEGNDAVYAAGTSAVVKNNCPPFVITNETFYNFFDQDNYLANYIPEGATLDFQGLFLGNISDYTVYINKPVNVISSTGDAVFQYVDPTGTDKHKENCIKFNVVAGADGTNVSDISIINGDLFVIGASNVTIDNVYMKANMSAIGQSTGFIAIHTGAYYTTVKNSYFENGGTGSSLLVLGKGGKYASFDNNVFNVTGSSGNVVSSNIFVGAGDNPECANYTNNLIYNAMPEAGTMYAMTVCGANNIVENNTIYNFKGSGIVNQFGATSTNNSYVNNFIYGGASLTAGTYSIIENNYLEGTLTIAEGCSASDNVAKTVTISGKHAVVDTNTFNGPVTISSAAQNTTFTNNILKDALTVNSNGNWITFNQIATDKDYAVDLKSTSENTVEDNDLSSVDKMGDAAVSYVEGKNNTVRDNGQNAIIKIDVADSWVGNNNTINVSVVNGTGIITLYVNDQRIGYQNLTDGKTTFAVDASYIKTGINNIFVDFYSENKNMTGDTKTATFYGLDNVVYTEVFFNYFDENGILRAEVPYDLLVFEGAFAKSSTVKYITINRPLMISSRDASLSLIGMVIDSDNVWIDGLKFTTTVNSAASELGDLINITGNNVILTNLDINYRVTSGDHDAIAIDAVNVENVSIINNKIVFESTISSDDYSANAINLDGVKNAVVFNNTVTTKLPGLFASNYDWDYFMMGLNTVNPVRVRNVTGLTFESNAINSGVKSLGKMSPTIQSLFVVGTKDATFKDNNFTMIDTVSKAGDVTFLYAINFGHNENITVENNNFELSTKSGVDASGSAYAIQIVNSQIDIIGNDIVTESNGPNLGIYVSMPMAAEPTTSILVKGNTIKVTGNATSKKTDALVSGIEVQDGEATIIDNQIIVENKAGFVEQAPVYGVSYAQYGYGCSLDIENNFIDVDGKYTVYVRSGSPANVTNNTLFAEKLYGDRSVSIDLSKGIVEDNRPMNAYLFVLFDNIIVGETAVFNITFDGNDTGEVTFVINEKEYKVDTVNGTGQVNISGLGVGEYPIVAYLSEVYPYGPDEFEDVLIVDKKPTLLNITVDDVKAGQDAQVTIQTGVSTGNLIAIIDGVEQELSIKKGKATTTIKEIKDGDHSIVVIYNGNDLNAPAYNATAFTVNKTEATVTITLPENITIEEDMVIGIETNSDAEVVVLVDGLEQEVVNGTVTIFNLAGDHTIVAYVNETVAYTSTIAFESYYVSKKESIVAINGTDAVVGEKTTITVTIPENATGYAIVVVDDDKFYSIEFMNENVGSVDVVFDKAGNHTVYATYLGDNFNDIGTSEDLTITVSEKEASDVNITTPEDFKIGEEANVTVSIPGATGNVTVIVDGTETTVPLDENGTAVVPINVTEGEHGVVVVYSGDETHDPVVKSTTFYAPTFASEFKNLTVDGSGLISGVLVSMDDTISNATITCIINGIDFNITTDENGMFSFNATFPATVEIIYEGTDAILPADVEVTLKDFAAVRAATVINSEDYETYAIDADAGEQGNYFKFQLVDANGNPLANKLIFIGFNGNIYNRTTNESGWAELQINLKQEGRYTFATTFLGDDNYNASFTINVIKVNKKKTSISASAKSYKASAKTKSYTVTLKTDKGSSIDGKTYLKAGKKITLKINGKTYSAKTNSKGQATFKLSITKKGKFQASIKFAGDKTYAASSKSVKITIK